MPLDEESATYIGSNLVAPGIVQPYCDGPDPLHIFTRGNFYLAMAMQQTAAEWRKTRRQIINHIVAAGGEIRRNEDGDVFRYWPKPY